MTPWKFVITVLSWCYRIIAGLQVMYNQNIMLPQAQAERDLSP